jgi:hypothetical protein
LVDRDRWTVAGTGPDSRYLLAHRDDVTVSAWTPGDLAAEIRREDMPADVNLPLGSHV